MRTLVVIPTYDEALNIETILTRTRRALPDADILVVDDNSPDDTAALVEKVGLELGRVDVLRRPRREGLGRAYCDAWTWALDHGYDAVTSMDADGSHDPAELPHMVELIEDGADLVMGSRYVPGGSVPSWAWYRRLLSTWGNRYAATMLDLPVRDATGGFRIYRGELLRRIALSSLRANGYGFQIELVYRAVDLHATVVEVPITFADRHLGTSKMSSRIIWEALVLVTWWAVRDRLLRTRWHGRSGDA
ncbi:MAG: polyprenol monophosphomannose synthase [Acidimicrobiales bacterium]